MTRLSPLPVLALALLPGMAAAEQITVFAAASLKTVFDKIAAEWSEATGERVDLAYAGSSLLARQIEQGAPADVFVSANEDWMDVLDDAGLIVPETRGVLLTNRLVLIAHTDKKAASMPSRAGPGSSGEWETMLDGQRVAMALVDAVPAGIYGKAALESLGLWDRIAPNVVQADNVRAALAFVAAGEVPYGIVYATDAGPQDAVSIAATFPDGSHPPIVYPAALVGGASEEAAGFLEFLRSERARHMFEAAGFGLASE